MASALRVGTGRCNLLKFRCAAISTIKTYSDSANKSSLEIQEKVTHTGQKWDSEDYRLARFIDRPKHVNTKFAIELIDSVPPQPRTKRVVWCDGGGGPTGHPKVYINLDKPGNHVCGYCGLRFFKDGTH